MDNSRSITISAEASPIYDELILEIGGFKVGRALSHNLITLRGSYLSAAVNDYDLSTREKQRESNKRSKAEIKAKKSAIEDLNRIRSQYGEDFIMDAIA